MRRGGPRGRGNRPMQMQRSQQQNQRSTESGPFMTGHLQGLKDIDMELELLKRKREIIEQQQHILSNSYRERNDYEQPMYNQSRENRYDDYTRLYDDRSSDSYGGGGGSSSRKRQHIPIWENEVPPKRFSAPSRGVKKAFGSRLGPQSNNPRSDFHRPSAPRATAPKPYRPRPAPPPKRKDFNPTKVTKPSAAAPPAKLASYKPAERKKLVTESLGNSSITRTNAPMNLGILRVDVEPSRQMNGRLELALGSIIKTLRQNNPDSEQLFLQPAAIRAMKKAVRERIWTVMVGKEVTTLDNIKAIYYEAYRSEGDNDIIMKGKEVQKGTDFVTVESADPEEYYKKNMHKLMYSKLEEMTQKLEELYTGKLRTPYKKRRQYFVKPKADAAVNTEDVGTKTEEAQSKTDESQSEKVQVGEDITEPKPDEIEAKGIETVESVESQPDESQVITDDSAPTDSSQVITDEVAIDMVPSEDSKKTDVVSDQQYKVFDKLMNHKMIHLLKKFSPTIVNIMDLDAMYRKTKAQITAETKKKLFGNSEASQSSQQASGNTSTPNKTPYEKRPPLLFVKILGKPGLPKRKAMQSFFEKFEPKCIKKHKSIHNLLFVGFTEKEAFDNILAADGTVIGRFTLDIKISERNDKKKPNNANDSVATAEKSESQANTSLETTVADLDEQITDLLTSIRNEEEMDASVNDLTSKQNGLSNENGADQIEGGVIETKKQEDDDVIEVKDNQGQDVVEIKDSEDDVVDINDVPQDDCNNENGFAKAEAEEKQDEVEEDKDEEKVEVEEKKDEVEETKDEVQALKAEVKEVKGTPTRASARLGTPGGIRTRRMSKLNE